jgi:hypothetical protein
MYGEYGEKFGADNKDFEKITKKQGYEELTERNLLPKDRQIKIPQNNNHKFYKADSSVDNLRLSPFAIELMQEWLQLLERRQAPVKSIAIAIYRSQLARKLEQSGGTIGPNNFISRVYNLRYSLEDIPFSLN